MLFLATQLKPVTSVETVGLQLSVAVAVKEIGASLGVIVGGALQSITGASVSSTVIICVQVLTLLQASVAVHVLVIVFSCGQEPGVTTSAKALTVGLLSQLSVAVAEPVWSGVAGSSHSIVTSFGQEISGGLVCTTLMVWTHELEFQASSVVVQVLVIVFCPGQDPSASLSEWEVVETPQLSVTEGLPVYAGPVG